MVDKKLINGLKYEKLLEEQLYDLSQWELVDIILAYRKDYKAKEQECEELKDFHINLVGVKECEIRELVKLKAENDLLRKTHKTEQDRRRAYEQALTEIKEIVESVWGNGLDEEIHKFADILQKCEVLDGNN